MAIRGSKLTEAERRGFEEVQAAQDEGRLCLVRSALDGRERAAICTVLAGDDGMLAVVPLALLITDDEAGRIVDPDGRPTTDRALGDLLEAGHVRVADYSHDVLGLDGLLEDRDGG